MISRNLSRSALLVTALSAGACSIGTDIDDIPTSARVRVEGTAPDEMRLILSTDFLEQINLDTGERSVSLLAADTLVLSLPYDETWPIGTFGSVYVEVYYAPTSTAAITLRVNLDNGESFERVATLSSGSSLVYYFVWSGPLP